MDGSQRPLQPPQCHQTRTEMCWEEKRNKGERLIAGKRPYAETFRETCQSMKSLHRPVWEPLSRRDPETLKLHSPPFLFILRRMAPGINNSRHFKHHKNSHCWQFFILQCHSKSFFILCFKVLILNHIKNCSLEIYKRQSMLSTFRIICV